MFLTLTIFLGLLSRYPPGVNIPFNTVYRHASTNYSKTLEFISWHDVLLLMKKGFIIKIFDKLKASLKGLNMPKAQYLSLKLDLLDEYRFPRPMPPDMMLKRPRGSDHAYLILGQQGTGKFH